MIKSVLVGALNCCFADYKCQELCFLLEVYVFLIHLCSIQTHKEETVFY